MAVALQPPLSFPELSIFQRKGRRVFPIRDNNPSETTPYVTYALIFLNIALFVITEPWLGNQFWLWQNGALYPVAVLNGLHEWGIVTHMFLHGGLLHLAGNMLFLWVFGDNMEDQMGHAGFLIFYLVCGMLAAAAQIAYDPQSLVPMVGASGAIAGVMGGYMLMFPKAKIEVIAIILVIIRRFIVAAWIILLAWLVLQLVLGAISDRDAGTAYWAHIGGFVAGVVLTIPLFLLRGGPAFWQRTHGCPPHPSLYQPTHIPSVRR